MPKDVLNHAPPDLADKKPGLFMTAFWLVTLAAFAVATWYTFAVAPEDVNQGIMQKIFYVHLPIAINTFLACAVVFIASIGYLLKRQSWWDDLAVAAARVAVLLCSGVLLTGMLWGHRIWHTWWSWTPRLTFSFMLWLLYVVYLLVRASVEGRQRRAVVGAVYGLVAFLDVPLVFLTARLVRSQGELHPPMAEKMGPTMAIALLLFFIAITLMTAGLILARYRLARLESLQAEMAGFEQGHEPGVAVAGGGA